LFPRSGLLPVTAKNVVDLLFIEMKPGSEMFRDVKRFSCRSAGAFVHFVALAMSIISMPEVDLCLDPSGEG